MKKIFNTALIFSLCSVLLLACSKGFINENPADSIPIDEALANEVSVANALNGAYSQLRSVSLWGRDLPVIGDLQADNTFLESRNTGRYLAQYDYNILDVDLVAEEIWRDAYTGILRCNQIIGASATGGAVPRLKAQAYAIRALLYFKLVNIYARPYTDNPDGLGVPLVLTYDPARLPARNKVSEVYTQIVSDLKTAFEDAPAYVNSIRLSKYAIEGLLANVYLYMGDNNNARASAIDVITNSGFTLVTQGNYSAYWANSGIQSNKVETMFEVDADAVNNNGLDDLGAMYNNGYQDIYASRQLAQLYSATDIRASLLIAGNTKSGAPAAIVNKYPNAANSDKDNLKVIRLSEVYLVAAEASYPENEPDALKYLNAVVAQRDNTFAGYSSTGAQLLGDIVQERRKELAFEGNRLFDLNRLKLPIVRVQNAGAIPAGQDDIYLTVPYSDYRRIYPIPLSEMQANPIIAKQQNPGY